MVAALVNELTGWGSLPNSTDGPRGEPSLRVSEGVHHDSGWAWDEPTKYAHLLSSSSGIDRAAAIAAAAAR